MIRLPGPGRNHLRRARWNLVMQLQGLTALERNKSHIDPARYETVIGGQVGRIQSVAARVHELGGDPEATIKEVRGE